MAIGNLYCNNQLEQMLEYEKRAMYEMANLQQQSALGMNNYVSSTQYAQELARKAPIEQPKQPNPVLLLCD